MAYKLRHYEKGKRGVAWDRKVYTTRTAAIIARTKAQKSTDLITRKYGVAKAKIKIVYAATKKPRQQSMFGNQPRWF